MRDDFSETFNREMRAAGRRGRPVEPAQDDAPEPRPSSASDGGAREYSVEPIMPTFGSLFNEQAREASEYYRMGGRGGLGGSIDHKEILG